MNKSAHEFVPFRQPNQVRLAALTLACVFTLGMLLGIHTLAEVDEQAPQWAHEAAQPRA